MKNSNAIGEKIIEKDRDDVGGTVFRIQFIFPNMERKAFLNEKLI